MNLVIVESPSKAKTISKYLDNTYEVHASVGHIRDLPKSNKKAIDIPAGFVPHYEISKGKEKIVRELKAISKKAKEIILATDPDREGEAIAWHIKEACGLKNPKRVVFYEITESAVKEAMKNPRNIDEHLRRSQEARRVLDRLVGYGLSGLIWKKLRYGLSAGRVQSPALRIVMEREREIRIFVPQEYWVISGTFKYKNGEELTLICDEEPKTEDETNRIVEIAQKNKNWKIVSIKQTEVKRSPRPPFITSTLEQTASSRLGFSPSKTMVLAQKLYEAGYISYMRTDSITIGKEALKQTYAEIEKVFGKEYLSPRTYATKRKSAQEAHEAIRPTKISKHEAGANDEQKRLYQLIWRRTIASQMTDAKTLRTKLSANIEEENVIPNFSINGSVILFPGWFSADKEARGENKEIPDLNKGDVVNLLNIESEQKETLPPPRYTEAGLIKELEKREIGRPSTYASIIRTILEREYVIKEGRALVPTDTGEAVSNFLEKNFAKYISDSFTAEMENDLDEIAEGKKEYEKTLSNFYKPFLKELKSKENIEKITNLGDADKKFKCPTCKSSMVIKLGRTGKFLSCKKFPKCTGALKIDGTEMEAPKETGETCPKCEGKLFEREGRYGKFIACGNYPKCKYVKQSEEEVAKAKTGVKCPKCSPGEIAERRGRFGLFYSCSDYPNCKFIVKSRPTGNLCPLCKSLMMEGTKTIPERCSDKTCPNHNPHKLAGNKR
ncbi:MAG: type I DNA topoisomerase [Patescibacteria group bacterium]|nr:type I DNA topoisomerase [Patescibacteria group bacterium]